MKVQRSGVQSLTVHCIKLKQHFFLEKSTKKDSRVWDPQGAMDKINMYIHEPHREM
jgi:hypothetical protein